MKDFDYSPEAVDLAQKDIRLACPFCGAENISCNHLLHWRFHYCGSCGAQGPISFRDVFSSRANWNTRITEAARSGDDASK